MTCPRTGHPCPRQPCPGADDANACRHVARLLEWNAKPEADRAAAMYDPYPYRPTPYIVAGRDVYRHAEFCPLGEGPCGNGAEPRQCQLHSPTDVWRKDCIACQAGRVVEIRGHTVAYAGYGYLMMTLAKHLESDHRTPVLIRPMTHDPDGMIPIDDFIRARLIR